MTICKKLFCLTLLVAAFAGTASGQGSNGWNMVLNSNHSAFIIKSANGEMTFYFDPAKDTLSFSMGSKKPMKDNFTVEVTLKNNTKPIFTSTDKNFNADKTAIIVAINDVSEAIAKIKVPSKPKYVISIKDRTVVKEKFNFEFVTK